MGKTYKDGYKPKNNKKGKGRSQRPEYQEEEHIDLKRYEYSEYEDIDYEYDERR